MFTLKAKEGDRELKDINSIIVTPSNITGVEFELVVDDVEKYREYRQNSKHFPVDGNAIVPKSECVEDYFLLDDRGEVVLDLRCVSLMWVNESPEGINDLKTASLSIDWFYAPDYPTPATYSIFWCKSYYLTHPNCTDAFVISSNGHTCFLNEYLLKKNLKNAN